MFSSLSRSNSAISASFDLSSANALDRATILSFGKGLIVNVPLVQRVNHVMT